MKKMILHVLVSCLVSNLWGQGQEHPDVKSDYQRPTDQLVIKKLENWQDLKFGLLMHWGLYSQLGIVESWALCSEDQSFQDRRGVPYTEFKANYFNQIKYFNPRQFNPDLWAAAAKDAGMRYVVFTTKHHDGFCLWDTRQTEFRITGPDSPFRDHPKANIAKEIFQAFRKKGFLTGTYFSKPDWHHPDYWSPLWATATRCNNYDIRKHPQMWKRFKDFTYNQIEELMTTLGPIDILWLDGGWVRPDSTITAEVRSWGYSIPAWEQDIDMNRIVKMARTHQPGLLVVNRSVAGPWENYRTPEQHVPPEGLPYPFEANMTITANWGYVPHSKHKSAETIIHTLVDVVAKGGNLILNIGPTPEGTFEKTALLRLQEIGRWMKINGKAIYATRKWKIWQQGEDIRFTCSKDGKTINVFALKWPGSTLTIKSLNLAKGSNVSLLGDDQSLVWKNIDKSLIIQLPPGLRKKSTYVWTFQINMQIESR